MEAPVRPWSQHVANLARAAQIAKALVERKGKVTVFVPHYAMSGGTLITLAADEIVMDANAVPGPVDPQIGDMPAASIVKAVGIDGSLSAGRRHQALGLVRTDAPDSAAGRLDGAAVTRHPSRRRQRGALGPLPGLTAPA